MCLLSSHYAILSAITYTYSDGLLVRTAKDAISHSSVPMSLHLDHAQDESLIKLASDTIPSDNIMVDMSHYEKEENLKKTAALVKYCADRGIATEAEPGRIQGGEDGVMGTKDLEGSYTKIEEAQKLVNTAVDVLAPSIGNIHEEYPIKGPTGDL